MDESKDSAIQISYTAESYRPYPGERVKFWVKVNVRQASSDQIMVRVWLPEGLAPLLNSCRCLTPGPQFHPIVRQQEQGQTQYQSVSWRFEPGQLEADQNISFLIVAQAGFPGQEDLFLRTWAEVLTSSDDAVGQQSLSYDMLTIQIRAKARALKYLPEIYHHEDHALMWRYLMIFDRVWSHYDEFFTNQSAYFDPHLTSKELLIYLAGWVGLEWDDQAPKAVQMRVIPDLVPKMVRLHQKRGTAAGLIEYLQIWLGIADEDVSDCIQIHENVAGNFVLSDQTALNNELVIGNTYHEVCRFTVTLTWPSNCKQLPEAFIRQIIEKWKPAYTTYQLELSQTYAS